MSYCGTSEQPGVYVQSDAAILSQLVSTGVPVHLELQWQPLCCVHELSMKFELHELLTPEQKLFSESQ